MREFTIQELEKIINAGDFDSLIGKIENDFFDCKEGIYNLSKDSQKIELAKDISSFANFNGGYILIGPKTDDDRQTHLGDEIVEISSFVQGLVDPNQYKKIIKSWIYPDEIHGLEIYWQKSKDDNSKGILIIRIPAQKEALKPFLICKTVEEENKISEKIFGYAERRGDESDPRKIKDIHRIMRDGLLYDKNIESRFNDLESVMQPLLKKRKEEEQENKDRDVTDKRVNKTLQSYGE